MNKTITGETVLQILSFLYRASFQRMEWKPTDVTILFVYCWISTCFRPTGPSSGEFVQLFTQPSGTNGCVNSCTNSPEDGHVGPKHVEIQQYTNKIVTSVGFHSICVTNIANFIPFHPCHDVLWTMPSPHPFALLQAYASHLLSPVPVVYLATSIDCIERFSSVSQLSGISDEEMY